MDHRCERVGYQLACVGTCRECTDKLFLGSGFLIDRTDDIDFVIFHESLECYNLGRMRIDEVNMRFAVLGAGRIGQLHAANLANAVRGAELIAVADIYLPAAEETAQQTVAPRRIRI